MLYGEKDMMTALAYLVATDPPRVYKYFRTFDGALSYFCPRVRLKNGNWKGLLVVDDPGESGRRGPQKAKQGIVDKQDFGNWICLPVESVPAEVRARFRDKLDG